MQWPAGRAQGSTRTADGKSPSRIDGRVPSRSPVGLLLGVRQFAWSSLQCVVDRLGDREEGLIACDQLPVG